MKFYGGEQYLTIGEVAKLIKRGTQTIKNWYEWQSGTTDEPVLPPVYTHLDARGTRYFREKDLGLLLDFRDSIKYGSMSEVSRTKWGKRGKEIKI